MQHQRAAGVLLLANANPECFGSGCSFGPKRAGERPADDSSALKLRTCRSCLRFLQPCVRSTTPAVLVFLHLLIAFIISSLCAISLRPSCRRCCFKVWCEAAEFRADNQGYVCSYFYTASGLDDVVSQLRVIVSYAIAGFSCSASAGAAQRRRPLQPCGQRHTKASSGRSPWGAVEGDSTGHQQLCR